MTDRELFQQALDDLLHVSDGLECLETIAALQDRLAQPEPEPEKSQDKPCVEDDGCPTEKAVLQRFWREHQAQPEPEPLGWIVMHEGINIDELRIHEVEQMGYDEKPTPNQYRVYTAPPKKEWVGLTNDAIEYIVDAYWDDPPMFIEAIEAKLKKENDF